ncbi:hypothetical protein K458DRAFT_362841 [Lentithecium fluviatile CBS 122367]|uniref:Uncharacterized protein n=1 Tax=Lentithecium fluviatile CBS 122367 TaxID=1168545 RepID=A0A6G1J8X4_9PLEO|nr:hypothetical protein K458DRAFT_362841 [Lentithecium fluviatile CBS 122367]
MAATRSDIQIAALAAGFTLGFGLLTCWEAIKQTRQNRNPLRSVYIYMIWGEIVVNLVIGIIGWIFLAGIIGPTVPVLFFILLCWVFEIQLLMQIIINRIALIAEHRKTIWRLKWGTVAFITAINVAVFCIWIPSHTNPPTSQLFVDINNIWDKISKVLIMLVDAGLNWYFLRTVETRLVNQHGLVKYKPLVGFNAKLMVVSILMDGMLIGLMFLPNPVVYIQFHPVAYMVKLNIEMSMASLVVKLARGRTETDMYDHHSSTDPRSGTRSHHPNRDTHNALNHPNHFQSFQLSSITKGHRRGASSDDELGGITRKTELNVVVESAEKDVHGDGSNSKEHSLAETMGDTYGDEIPLHKNGLRIQETKVV